MSPLSLRRYRAERLLREDFERLRGAVLALAGRRLTGAGVHVDASDLEEFYAQAWQGLHAAVIDGEQVANPVGWLALVTFRRAIEEQRSATYARRAGAVSLDEPVAAVGQDLDYASALDDRIRLRQLMEGMRVRLSARERQAASLCYLQGYSRAQASQRMGLSESRLRKLMDGDRGRRGVAQKIGALVGTIAAGEWCAEQGSLMRGFAYGVLDPAGERYRFALAHQSHCPACRSYVLELRGLAAVLPPAPWLLAWVLGSGAGAGVAKTTTAAAGAGSGAPGAGAGLPAGSAAGVGAGAGVASAGGAAGGGWLLAAGSGAKLAAGCLLAIGVGAGCVALSANEGAARERARTHGRGLARQVREQGAAAASRGGASGGSGGGGGAVSGALAGPTAVAGPAARARREFGLEGGGGPIASIASSEPAIPRARAASVSKKRAPPAPAGSTPASSAPPREPVASTAAAREFAPG